MDEPQPISTAPTDDTVILTDCGFVRRWSDGLNSGWVECDPWGNPYECAGYGMTFCEPKRWTPVPSWVLKTN